MVMVAVAVAKHLSKQVDGFCVSNLDEALELRQAGLEQPILILGVVLPDEVPLAIQEKHHSDGSFARVVGNG